MMNVAPVKKELFAGLMLVCDPLQGTQTLFTFKVDYINCVFLPLLSCNGMYTDIWKSIYTFAIVV